MKLKHWISLLLVVALLAGMAAMTAGCSSQTATESQTETTASQEDAAPETSDSADAETEENEESAEPVTLKVLFGFADFEEPMKELAAKYMEEHPNITVELISGVATDLLPAMIQQKDYPDVSVVPDGFDSVYASQDLLLDLSDRPVVQRATADNLATHTVDGKIVSISTGAGVYGIYYNKALFAEAGIETVPTTFTELEAAVEQLKAAGIVPFVGAFKDSWVMGQYFRYGSAGVFTQNAPLTEQITAGERSFTDADVMPLFDGTFALIDLIRDNMLEGSLELSTGEAEVKFAQGEAAMYMLGDWSMATMLSANPDAANRDVTGFMPLITSDVAEDNRYLVFYNAGHGIFKDSAHLEEAIDFFDYMFSKEGLEIIYRATQNPGPFSDSDTSWANEFKQDVLAALVQDGTTWTDLEYLKLPSMVAGLNSAMDGYMKGTFDKETTFAELQKAVDVALAAQ